MTDREPRTRRWSPHDERMVRGQATGWGVYSLHVWSNATMLAALATLNHERWARAILLSVVGALALVALGAVFVATRNCSVLPAAFLARPPCTGGNAYVIRQNGGDWECVRPAGKKNIGRIE